MSEATNLHLERLRTLLGQIDVTLYIEGATDNWLDNLEAEFTDVCFELKDDEKTFEELLTETFRRYQEDYAGFKEGPEQINIKGLPEMYFADKRREKINALLKELLRLYNSESKSEGTSAEILHFKKK